MDPQLRIRVTLAADGDRFKGAYVYASTLREAHMEGSIDPEGQHLTLTEYSEDGHPTGRFTGEFPTTGPRGHYSAGSKLSCEVITGTWTSADGKRSRPFYPNNDGGIGGSLDARYAQIDAASNATIEDAASRFRDATIAGNRKTVTAALAYPLDIRVGGRKLHLRNAPGAQARLCGHLHPGLRCRPPRRHPAPPVRSGSGRDARLKIDLV